MRHQQRISNEQINNKNKYYKHLNYYKSKNKKPLQPSWRSCVASPCADEQTSTLTGLLCLQRYYLFYLKFLLYFWNILFYTSLAYKILIYNTPENPNLSPKLPLIHSNTSMSTFPPPTSNSHSFKHSPKQKITVFLGQIDC